MENTQGEIPVYDFIVIGGGCAGPSGAMYAARLNLKTLMIAEMPGGLITTTHIVENWPGIVSISGPDLGMSLWNHAKEVGCETRNARVNKVSVAEDGKGYIVETRKEKFYGKTILFATGTKHKELGAPGEQEFKNRGVSYCALCDGAFFKDKIVSVVGGGDSAAKEALFLAQHAKKVYVIVRKNFMRAEPRNMDLMTKTPNVEVLYETEIVEILGTDNVEKVRLKSGEELEMQGVFMAIGHIPLTDLAKDLGVTLSSHGEILINRHSETNLPGVYAAGDCCDTEFKQAITGSAEGVTASYYAFEHLKNQLH